MTEESEFSGCCYLLLSESFMKYKCHFSNKSVIVENEYFFYNHLNQYFEANGVGIGSLFLELSLVKPKMSDQSSEPNGKSIGLFIRMAIFRVLHINPS